MTFSPAATLPFPDQPDRTMPIGPEFPPADWAEPTQELLDALPQRWSRGLLYAMVLFGAVALPWATLSPVDEVGQAKGRLEPKGKTMRIDAATTGTVAKVHVKEGQTVKAGDRLLELNADLLRNQQQQLQTKLESQLNRLVQLQSAQRQMEIQLQTQRLQLQAQLNEQMAEYSRTASRIAYYEKATGLTQEVFKRDQVRADRFRNFQRMGIIPGVQAEDAERAALETQQRLSQTDADLQQAMVDRQKLTSTYERMQREGEIVLLTSNRQVQDAKAEIGQIRAEITQTKQQLESLALQLQQSIVTVPIAGTVFELPVSRPGAVMQPGEQIATIAPQDAPLILRAKLSSRESGFVKVGLPVKIKFDAYPFQDYGIIPGKVRWIAPNSKVQPTAQGTEEIYDVEIELSQTYIQVGKKTLALAPGQTASAEIIIRQRRVIDFFLDPFKQLQKDGMVF
jgi:hemolysin D